MAQEVLKLPYWEWIEREAKRLGTDGCTLAMEWQVHCCYEHDLASKLERDPRAAYAAYLNDSPDPWQSAAKMSRPVADYRFWRCNRAQKDLYHMLRSDIRYLGVTFGTLYKKLKGLF